MLTAIQVQKALKQLSYWDGASLGDIRDPLFRAALRRFQLDNGLTVDGWYGAKSDAALSPLVDAMESESSPKGGFTLRRFRLTWYHIAEEGYTTGSGTTGRTIPVIDQEGAVLAMVTPTFFTQISLEGTGRVRDGLRDGRLFNVTGKYRRVKHADYAEVMVVARKNNWLPDKAGYAGISLDDSGTKVDAVLTFYEIPSTKLGKGYGIQKKMPLDPFRTLATDIGAYRTSDPTYRGKGGLVPTNSKIWIANFVGQKLPGGGVHDGWCVSGDTGGAIYGAHFDVFTGTAALKKKFTIPAVGYAWFETPSGGTSETRMPPTYTYGV